MTSSAKVVDLNGKIFGRTICRLSLVVIALIFSELRDQKKPCLRVNNAPSNSSSTEKKKTEKTPRRLFLNLYSNPAHNICDHLVADLDRHGASADFWTLSRQTRDTGRDLYYNYQKPLRM